MVDRPSPRARLSRDTDAAIERRQIAAWRAATSSELALMVGDASEAVRALAMAGLRSRYPLASERELLVRFAALTMGTDVASPAYPELRDLNL